MGDPSSRKKQNLTTLESEMLKALKTVDPLVKMLLRETRGGTPADWGFVNNSLVAISSVIRKVEGK